MSDVFAQSRAFEELVRWAHGWNVDADIERAFQEDLGTKRTDVTSEMMIDRKQDGVAVVASREPGRLAGLALLSEVVLHASAMDVEPTPHKADGDMLAPGDQIATLRGSLRDILKVERTLLNYLTHLSGVATLTAKYVEAVAGTNAKIYDTRKTLPGLRWLQKYAVTCGGGHTHRLGLYDAMLVKDNHIAHIPLDELPDRLADAAEHARKKVKGLKFVEVEVDSLDQLARVLTAPIDMVLLDNMTNDQLCEAVTMRNERASHVELEASGGVGLDTVGEIAATGIDRVSVGALTHSAPALDIGLDIATGSDPTPGSAPEAL